MVELFANSGDPDQMPHSTASDMGLHCLPFTLLEISSLQWVNLCHSLSNLADNKISNIFLIFPPRTGFDISCRLSTIETICTKCHILFSGKNSSNFREWQRLKKLYYLSRQFVPQFLL